ncbi:hypothetical protein PF008_g26223 [Phytophthora fragariae]|uniref:Uncharacterized protein n=1 Tax=Phytophthora fragariae TaxID=53985 RepID=A0A6G0QIL7_9STRA|nr:hypothetical protein PF008_g26223 [Phytophthora fragariae]
MYDAARCERVSGTLVYYAKRTKEQLSPDFRDVFVQHEATKEVLFFADVGAQDREPLRSRRVVPGECGMERERRRQVDACAVVRDVEEFVEVLVPCTQPPQD